MTIEKVHLVVRVSCVALFNSYFSFSGSWISAVFGNLIFCTVTQLFLYGSSGSVFEAQVKFLNIYISAILLGNVFYKFCCFVEKIIYQIISPHV